MSTSTFSTSILLTASSTLIIYGFPASILLAVAKRKCMFPLASTSVSSVSSFTSHPVGIFMLKGNTNVFHLASALMVRFTVTDV